MSLGQSVLIALAAELVSGHGYMTFPQARNLDMDGVTGNQTTLGSLLGGPCGKSLHATEKKNYSVNFQANHPKWEVTDMAAGSRVNVSVKHTAGHGGFDSFWFMCTSQGKSLENQVHDDHTGWEQLVDCDDASKSKFHTTMGQKGDFTWCVKAPKACPNGGVFQWFWSELEHQKEMAVKTEEWRNCADVRVSGFSAGSGANATVGSTSEPPIQAAGPPSRPPSPPMPVPPMSEPPIQAAGPLRRPKREAGRQPPAPAPAAAGSKCWTNLICPNMEGWCGNYDQHEHEINGTCGSKACFLVMCNST